MTGQLLPCRTCPFRVGNDASEIPGIDRDQAEALAAQCPTAGSSMGGALMACHKSPEGDDRVCIGWATSDASRHSIPLRFAMRDGRVPPWPALRDAADAAGIDLYASHADMLAQVDATLNDQPRKG